MWQAAPFVLAAFVTTAACAAPILWLREDGGHGRVFQGVRAYFKRSWQLLREEAEVRRFLIANAAWEGAFAGARRQEVVPKISRGSRPKRLGNRHLPFRE